MRGKRDAGREVGRAAEGGAGVVDLEASASERDPAAFAAGKIAVAVAVGVLQEPVEGPPYPCHTTRY
jgi:hypothetical protein